MFVLARVWAILLTVATVSLVQACGLASASRIPTPSPAESVFALATLAEVVEKYVEHEQLERFELRARVGGPLVTIPKFDYQTAREDARFARAAVRRIDAIDVDALSEPDYLTLLALRRSLQGISERVLFFANDLTLFTPGSPLADVMRMMTQLPLRDSTDTERYLSLLLSLEPVADSLRSDLVARAARGIVLSRPAIVRATQFFSAFTLPAERHVLHVGSWRLTLLDTVSARRFTAAVDSIIDKRIAPGYRRLTTFLSGAYGAQAPNGIGLWQYVGGKEYYATLVRHWTTLDITPEQTHDAGLREVARLDSALQALRTRIGGPFGADSFHTVLRGDASNQARDAEAAVERILMAQAQLPTSTDSTRESVKVWPVIVSGPGDLAPADRIFGTILNVHRAVHDTSRPRSLVYAASGRRS